MSSVVQNLGKRTGRPRGFDEKHVVAAARDLFWAKGLEGTSYDELTAATGLHRPSIHAAFGDKRGLFEAAAQRYLDDSRVLIAAALTRPTLREALSDFFSLDISLFTTSGDGRGCYILGVTAEAGRHDPEFARIEGNAWQNLKAAIASRVGNAPEGEIPSGLNRLLLVDLVLAIHSTLALRARAGASRVELGEGVDRFLRLFDDENRPATPGPDF